MYWIIILLLIVAICFLLVLLIQRKQELDHWHWKCNELEKLHTAVSTRYHIIGRLSQSDLLHRNLQRRNISSLYIYGGGIIGRQLYSILHKKKYIQVTGIIDQEFINSSIFDGLPTYTSDRISGIFSKQDWIVITPIFAYDKILPVLLPYIEASHIITLDELLID